MEIVKSLSATWNPWALEAMVGRKRGAAANPDSLDALSSLEAGSSSSGSTACPSLPSEQGDVLGDAVFDFAEVLEEGGAQQGWSGSVAGEVSRSVEVGTASSSSKSSCRRLQCMTIVQDPDHPAEFSLRRQNGELLLHARLLQDSAAVEFFTADTWSSMQDLRTGNRPSDQKTKAPFAMRHDKAKDSWLLVQTLCECCYYKPKHLKCDGVGKAQQVACIQHLRVGVAGKIAHAMTVHLPALRTTRDALPWCPVAMGRDLGPPAQSVQGVAPTSPSLPERLVASGCHDGYSGSVAQEIHLTSKLPRWSKKRGGVALSFKGHGVQPSTQNFKLCQEVPGRSSPEVILQHCKVGEHNFALDLKYPLSPIQAFAIAMTSHFWD